MWNPAILSAFRRLPIIEQMNRINDRSMLADFLFSVTMDVHEGKKTQEQLDGYIAFCVKMNNSVAIPQEEYSVLLEEAVALVKTFNEGIDIQQVLKDVEEYEKANHVDDMSTGRTLN